MGSGYAQEEYDKLIVYLSSGGLILTVGFVKDLVDLTTAQNKWLLIASWGGFIFSLILILLSHKSAIRAMTLELEQKPDESDDQDYEADLCNKLSGIGSQPVLPDKASSIRSIKRAALN